MQMQRAFNAKFLVNLTRYVTTEGSYNDDNDWVSGVPVPSSIRGRVVVGNKLSRFEEGMAIHNEDGGKRVSDFKNIYITDKYQLNIGEIVEYKGVYYNVIQESDETQYGFKSFLCEKSERWAPT